MKVVSYLIAFSFGLMLSDMGIDLLTYKAFGLLALFITFGMNEAWIERRKLEAKNVSSVR